MGRRDVRRTFGCTHGRVALLASHQGVTAAVSEGHWGMAVRNQSPEPFSQTGLSLLLLLTQDKSGFSSLALINPSGASETDGFPYL